MASNKTVFLVCCIFISMVNYGLCNKKIETKNNTLRLVDIIKVLKVKQVELKSAIESVEHNLDTYKGNAVQLITTGLQQLKSRLEAKTTCLSRNKNKILNLSFNGILNIFNCDKISEAINSTVNFINRGMNLFSIITTNGIQVVTAIDNCTQQQQNPFASFSCFMGQLTIIQNQIHNITTLGSAYYTEAQRFYEEIVNDIMYCVNSNNGSISNNIQSIMKQVQNCV